MRRVVIVAFPRVQSLDVLGPAEVFGTATQPVSYTHLTLPTTPYV